jgi:hypothetical protein
MPFSFQEARSELDAVAGAVVDARAQVLREALQLYGGEWRDDSFMTWLYCTVPDLDVYDVACEITCTNQLYNDTAYSEVLEGRLQAAANYLKSVYPTARWTRVWEVVRQYGVMAVKIACASQPAMCT